MVGGGRWGGVLGLSFMFVACVDARAPEEEPVARIDPPVSEAGEAPSPAPQESPAEETPPVVETLPPPDNTGRLCGAPDYPCTRLLRETLPAPHYLEPTEPHALALDGLGRPFVMGVGWGDGVLAVRLAPGQWEVQPLPGGWRGAAFSLSSEGRPLMTRFQGDELSLWEEVSGTWQRKGTLGKELQPVGHSLVTDPSGGLHTLLTPGHGRPLYASTPGVGARAWSLQPVGSGGPLLAYPGLALSPSGKAHLAFWEKLDGQWSLTWQDASSRLERIDRMACCESGGWYPTEYSPILAAMTGPGHEESARTRHVFYTRAAPVHDNEIRDVGEVTYARRVPGGTWTVYPLLRGEALQTCENAHGPVCETNHIQYTTVAVAAGARDEVRAFVARRHQRTEWRYSCEQGFCHWSDRDSTSEDRLEMVWLDGEALRRMTVWEGEGWIGRMEARVDSQGGIHLAGVVGDQWTWFYLSGR